MEDDSRAIIFKSNVDLVEYGNSKNENWDYIGSKKSVQHSCSSLICVEMIQVLYD